MQIDSYFVAKNTKDSNAFNGVIIPTESGKIAEAEMVLAYYRWINPESGRDYKIVSGPFLTEWEAFDSARKLGIDACLEDSVLSEMVSG